MGKHGSRRICKITTLFRVAEAFVVLIMVSRFCTNLAFSFVAEYFRGISTVDLIISPRSVFVLGNVIVIALLLISGRHSGKTAEKSADPYDEYVEKCRSNEDTWRIRRGAAPEGKVLSRTHSANLDRPLHVRRSLRRSMSEQCRKSGKKAAAAEEEEQMSSEQFRKTVEAFIARQKYCLREEEDFSA